jgi:hypothetical protein
MRIICIERCITVPPFSLNQLRQILRDPKADAKFTCPICFMQRHPPGKYIVCNRVLPKFPILLILSQALVHNGDEYAGQIGPRTIRNFFPRMDTASLGIINLRFKAIAKSGDPFVSISNSLKGWFPDGEDFDDHQLRSCNVAFNLNPSKLATFKAHWRKIEETVAIWKRLVSVLQVFKA